MKEKILVGLLVLLFILPVVSSCEASELQQEKITRHPLFLAKINIAGSGHVLQSHGMVIWTLRGDIGTCIYGLCNLYLHCLDSSGELHGFFGMIVESNNTIDINGWCLFGNFYL